MNLKTLLIIFAFWMILATLYILSLTLDALKFKTGFQLSGPMLGTFLLVYLSWALLTVMIAVLIRKPVIEANFKAIFMVFIMVFLIWQPIIILIDNASMKVFSGEGFPDVKSLFVNLRFAYVFFNITLYMVVFTLCAGVIYHQYSKKMKARSAELEKKNMMAELNISEMKMHTLQSQLSPHFLFNCLNSISALTRVAEKDLVIKSIARLGDLLRFSLNASQKTYVSLIKEIEFTGQFIALQKLRFGHRFNYVLEYQSELNDCLCPPFILQTLVENVFTHGIGDDDSEIEIKVVIKSEQNKLHVSVTNSQQQMSSHSSNGLGLAINNLANRLNLLYEDDCKISTKQDEHCYVVEIQIPLRLSHE